MDMKEGEEGEELEGALTAMLSLRDCRVSRKTPNPSRARRVDPMAAHGARAVLVCGSEREGEALMRPQL
jgi:hypothetical protein